jgi:cell wall-associated NlpC family hydrolase
MIHFNHIINKNFWLLFFKSKIICPSFLLILTLFIVFNPNSIFANTKAYINSDYVNCRAEASLGAPVITTLNKGTEITILESTTSWYKIALDDNTSGWVFSKFISLGPLDSDENNPSLADQIISYAKTFLGIKYVYGGASITGFDCSGFTMHVFSKFNINLPHSSISQFDYGEKIGLNNLIPGDLVFFKTLNSTRVNHVGIYLGNGQFIHASSGAGYVKIDTLLSGYYYNRFQGGRRIIKPNKNTPL